jgi:hypothetical protein
MADKDDSNHEKYNRHRDLTSGVTERIRAAEVVGREVFHNMECANAGFGQEVRANNKN